jgi:hypothetical protein
MSLNLRSSGTPLTQNELDNNLTFLYSRDITGSTVTGTTLFLYKQDGTFLETQLPSNSGGTSTATTFTGNTSASCITDLYVSNIYGCSPITVHDSIQNFGSSATGITSFAFGNTTIAAGDWSHAEGYGTQTIGIYSHAEGAGTQAIGYGSHAEGSNSVSIGQYSHAEGSSTQTIGNYSHAEGSGTHSGAYAYLVSGTSGNNIVLNPSYGDVTSEFNSTSIVFVYNSSGSGAEVLNFSATSYNNITSATTVVVSNIGLITPVFILPNPNNTGIYNPLNADQILGTGSHAEGNGSQAIGQYSHAEGNATQSIGNISHAEGELTQSIGYASHAEGESTQSIGASSHAEGYNTQSIGIGSHAEGSNSQAIGYYSHAEGNGGRTGQYFYTVDSVSGGAITIDVIYGNVSVEFTATGIILEYSGTFTWYELDQNNPPYFNSPNTIVTLVDTSVSSGTNVGVPGVFQPTAADILLGGASSHAEGEITQAIGPYSHAEGNFTTAIGIYSHAEGVNTQAIGGHSHAEGASTQSIGQYSHAEGNSTQSIGQYSHAEGVVTKAIGTSSHAEGNGTQSIGEFSHSEGLYTNATGQSSHAEGVGSQALDIGSHAEGYYTQAFGDYSHAEGSNSQAIGYASHAEGSSTQTIGNYSHAEGSGTYSGAYAYLVSGTSGNDIVLNPSYGDVTSEFNSTTTVFVYNSSGVQGEVLNFSATSYDSITSATTVVVSGTGLTIVPYYILPNPRETGTYNPLNADQILGTWSHAEGSGTQAIGTGSHTEGYVTQSIGQYSHAEGFGSQSIGVGSHAEGVVTKAIGNYSHAEGGGTIAIGQYSHAEGVSTQSIGNWSHAEGFGSQSIGGWSHAEGSGTIASGTSSHSQGILTISSGNYSFASGSASTASGIASFIHSSNSTVSGNRSVVLGGQGISGTSNDFVYVSNLNINNQPILHTGTTSQVLVRNTTTGNVEVKNIGNVYYCALDINDDSQPNAGVIPSVPVNNGGIADYGSFITGFTQIVSNGIVSTASGIGNYVTSPPSCSFGIFDNNFGIFTITQAGLYLVEGIIHLKPNTSSSFYWQTGSTSGTFGLGICDNTITNIYGGNYMTVQPNLHTEIDITTSILLYVDGTTPKYVSLKHLNWTNRSYDGTVYPNGDGIRFSITKVY